MRVITILLLLFIPTTLFCQTYQSEVKDDDYMPMTLANMKFSPPYNFQTSEITTVQVNTSANGMNIVDDAANEPSLGVNPLNPNEMVIGWRQFDNIGSNFRQAGIAYTEDGGVTWTNLPPIEAGLFRSDPVLATNSDGKFFYNSLAEDFSCDVFATTDLEDWSDQTYAYGGDKQWMVIDNTETSSNGNIYAIWKAEFSDCDGNFTVSYDGGETYEPCTSVTNNPTRGTLTVDPDGAVYACGGWAGTYRILRSESASDSNLNLDWEYSTVVDLKGQQALYAGPNPNGMLGQVWIATDHSDLETRGNVYLLSSTERNDNSDPCDVMFSASTDNGQTWSEAIKINDDNSTTNWQWFGTLSVAPNSRIDAVWLDTRDFPGDVQSSLYYSNSYDGGLTWSENERLSEEFDPHLGWPNQSKMGDYFHMVSTDEHAFLAWGGTFNGEQDIYFSKITPSTPPTSMSVFEDKNEIKIYPNPFEEALFLEIPAEAEVITEISIYDIDGRAMVSNFEKNYNKRIALNDMIAYCVSGVYFVKVSFEEGLPQYVRVVKK